MVTASRDSTVKVWEADWQIRMVFVGHTGVPQPGNSCSSSLSS